MFITENHLKTSSFLLSRS